jgi:hypothetical protein
VDYYDFDNPKIHKEAVRCLREIALAGGRWAEDCLARMKGDVRFSRPVRILAHNAIESLKFPRDQLCDKFWFVSGGPYSYMEFTDHEQRYTLIFTSKERAEAAMRECGIQGTVEALDELHALLFRDDDSNMIKVDFALGNRSGVRDEID